MADFFELLKTRRSVRNYQDKDVSLNLLMEIIRCLLPVGLIFRIHPVPESGNRGIHNNCKIFRFVFLQKGNQCTEETENSRNILSFRISHRIVYKCPVGPKN